MPSNTASAAASERPPSSIERLRIAGLTGVDVGLEIAGPGSRSYAFLIDWQIRLLLALGWIAVVAFVQRVWGLPAHVKFAYAGGAPAAALYLLYHPVLEVLMHGRTPGKRRAGLRLVTRSGGTPGIGALLIRNVFRLIDCLPTLYVVGLVCCFLTRQRVRIGDLAAGTLLVVDMQQHLPSSALAAVAAGSLDPAAAELIEELLERWDSLTSARRTALAQDVLARLGDAGRGATAGSGQRNHSDFELRERLRRVLYRARPVDG